jgi:hypothetical protein
MLREGKVETTQGSDYDKTAGAQPRPRLRDLDPFARDNDTLTQRRRLQVKTIDGAVPTRQDTVDASKGEGKSIEDMEVIVVERFGTAIKSSSLTCFSASSSREGSAEENPGRDDGNGADMDAASAVSERRRWGNVRSLRKLVSHRKKR